MPTRQASHEATRLATSAVADRDGLARGRRGTRMFACLKPDRPGLDAILGAPRKTVASVLAHVPGVARKTLQDLGNCPMHLSPESQDMAGMAEAARAFAHKHQGYDQLATITAAANRCEAVLTRTAR